MIICVFSQHFPLAKVYNGLLLLTFNSKIDGKQQRIDLSVDPFSSFPTRFEKVLAAIYKQLTGPLGVSDPP